MKGDFARRLIDAEDRAKAMPSKPGRAMPERWLEIAAMQYCAHIKVFQPDAPSLFERLYLAIDMGNQSGDDSGERKYPLRKRFDWAVYHASRVRLGLGLAGRWHNIQFADPDTDAWFDQFLAELPERHPELIGQPPTYTDPDMARRFAKTQASRATIELENENMPLVITVVVSVAKFVGAALLGGGDLIGTAVRVAASVGAQLLQKRPTLQSSRENINRMPASIEPRHP